MAHRIGSAIALALLFATRATAQTNELHTFECTAAVGQEHYHVVLSRRADSAQLHVRTDSASIANGPAISYRSGTRYYIATGASTGIKLTTDRDPARICFGAGGTDCYTCVAAAPARSYTELVTCTAQGFTLSAYRSSASYPDLIITDNHGDVIARGPGAQWGRISDYFTLPIGPGESYQVEFSDNGACSSSELSQPDPPPPVTTDARCEAGSGRDSIAFELRHQGDEPFAIYFYGAGGYAIGPITTLADGRILLPGGPNAGVTYQPLTEATGEICDGADCVPCTAAPSD
jgi:hypothetical protein